MGHLHEVISIAFEAYYSCLVLCFKWFVCCLYFFELMVVPASVVGSVYGGEVSKRGRGASTSHCGITSYSNRNCFSLFSYKCMFPMILPLIDDI